MGKKLSFEEQLESLDGIKTLYFSWNRDTSTNLRNVEVVDEVTGNVIFNIQVPINISPGTESYKINKNIFIGNTIKYRIYLTIQVLVQVSSNTYFLYF